MKALIRIAAFLAIIANVWPAHADVCVYETPTVRHIWGWAMDRSGYPIPEANVSVLRDGKVIANMVTNETGQFDFDLLQRGVYEIDVTARGFVHARYRVKLVGPAKSDSHALRIDLAVGMLHCGGGITVIRSTPQQAPGGSVGK